MKIKCFIKSSYLLLVLLLSLLSSSCSNTGEDSLIIDDSVSSFTIGRSAYSYIENKNLSIKEIRNLPESDWEQLTTDQKHFGIGPEVIWLRVDLENRTKPRKWYLVSEYSFIDSITLYYTNQNKKLTIQSGGAAVPVSKRVVHHRLTILPLELLSGVNRIWIRIESKFEKKLGLTLVPPEKIASRDNFPYNLYTEFNKLIAIIVVLCLLCVFILRNRLFLLYLCYLVSLSVYMGVWEGYALYYFYPENPGWNNHFNYSFGFLFGFILIIFWKRLLTLSVQLPWYNKIMNTLAWTTLGCSIYGLFPFAYFPFLCVIARILTIFLTASAFIASLRIVLMGQRYAIFSLLGCVCFFASMCIFLFSGIWLVPGNEFTKNPLYLGFSLELILLVVSLIYRVKFINNLRADKVPEPEFKNSRISNFDLRTLVSTLNSLMNEEKLFSDANLNQESLAGTLSISRHQLSELLREVYGLNFYGFINCWRIREAKELLLDDKERSILSIAMAVGYNSKSTFNQAFKNNTGSTPTEFRNSDNVSSSEPEYV